MSTNKCFWLSLPQEFTFCGSMKRTTGRYASVREFDSHCTHHIVLFCPGFLPTRAGPRNCTVARCTAPDLHGPFRVPFFWVFFTVHFGSISAEMASRQFSGLFRTRNAPDPYAECRFLSQKCWLLEWLLVLAPKSERTE